MSKSCIAFDIETTPIPESVELMPIPEVKLGNLKDPIKIEAKRAEALAKAKEKAALSPLYGKICSYAFYNEEFAKSHASEDEALLITEILSIMSTYDSICTWNGCHFDMPFLYKRAVLNGVHFENYAMPCLPMATNKYRQEFHTDLSLAWDLSGFTSLDEVSKMILNGQSKIEIDYKDFAMMLQSEEGRIKLEQYNLQDTILTWKLYKKFKGTLIS